MDKRIDTQRSTAVKITYTGPHDAVEVPGVGVVKHGDTLTVPDAVGQSLLEQETNWQPVTTVKRKEQ
jgi:hypothetical protein